MPGFKFPDPFTTDLPLWCSIHKQFHYGQGVVHIGPGLELDKIKEAFHNGIFPWGAEGDKDIPWHCPIQRAIIDFSKVRVPRSLAKVIRSGRYSHTIDRDFENVMRGCRQPRKNQDWGSWISEEHLVQFTKLHRQGIAHSVETWDEDGSLVGGLFGMDAGGLFCGQSMFHTKSNASKCALLFLIDHLRSRGATWLDAQVMSPHIQKLGATETPRALFLYDLKEVQGLGLKLF
jgi:leucyl/phenylalanyl-tRNA--protein transferase